MLVRNPSSVARTHVIRAFRFAASVLLVVVLSAPAGATFEVPDPAATLDPPDPVEPPGYQGAASSGWELPVQRRVADRFRPPVTDWGAGNRGWEFATSEGDPVVAVGAGVVTFAGWVAGRGVVTIDHGGGLLSSVTGMTGVLVLRGQAVGAGHLLGRAQQRLHLGFRQDGTYIDPALLYTRVRHAVLVPVPDANG